MPRVPFTSFFYGPAAVYPSPTGERNSRTYTPMLGTQFIVGNYSNLSEQDAQTWNEQYNTNLHAGRYRIVKLSPSAVLANIGVGLPLGWALGSSVESVGIADAGSGYNNGTFYCASSATSGQTAATAEVVISGGAIISATIVNGGSGFTGNTPPTFSLDELSGGSDASIIAQLYASGYEVSTYDSSAVSVTSLVRAICLTPTITQDQIDAGSAIIVQEGGIAPLLVHTATEGTVGIQAVASTGGVVTTQTPAFSAAEIGYTLDSAAAGELIRGVLTLPILEG